ncbi:hypothetical protein LB534_16190 [Mesorhizobium sp. CA18]|uniref:hypothetical protein n=1 Tax=unclassified Mesorhizobium TaxID=325217 RepID=UPI001CCA5315|nr:MULTISPECIES: hypothetical protein [unclassified Mesorhizobium]MBZ9736501.1 hypothetical protein [Mesorhizobium sp. CA9]MBZ9826825.1 hypothetical protein [Mesorhizobium sp. CA18]MBZ9834564.1 hypothetical protein [Mesorhizobium sp. CA2]MBZ9838399.1 hypothetical protein [Mesorhizobium sp. CA3]MBZ9879100.1 hypothetical protein [Mesorhizobium sp. Ca11]
MSEYQYYEFQAVDRPLGNADRHVLRDLSSRARITAASFTNFYEWGDFKGDPDELMERWFDLHLYWANWGSRRLMIKLPARLVDRDRVDAFLGATDDVMLRVAGENIIISIARDELEFEYLDDDDSGWLSALAPLRADLLAGDLRLFYLLWLMAVEAGAIEPDEPEPMPGIGPLTEALEAFAEFFGIDRDLVQAAAERSATTGPDGAAPDIARRVVAAMSDVEKTSLLMRVFNGEPNMSAELRATIRARLEPETTISPGPLRTAADLQARAEEIRLSRKRAEAALAEAQRRLQAEAAEKARDIRVEVLRQRGENVWEEVEVEIGRRNPAGYDKAAALLSDLLALAEKQGSTEDFRLRLQSLRERHAGKGRFLERLVALG